MSRRVRVGEIVGAFGVLGWVKVKSHTQPPQNILRYAPWLLGPEPDAKLVEVAEGRQQGTMVVARLEGVENRDQAAALKGTALWVPRESFPRAPKGVYYWADLVGLEVYTVSGQRLGTVDGLLETGANDVLEVKGDRDRLIPFVQGQYVQSVDLDQGRLVVDWDPDF